MKITPKKKVLKLTIDRESVVKAKKVKEPKQPKGGGQSRTWSGDEAGDRCGG